MSGKESMDNDEEFNDLEIFRVTSEWKKCVGAFPLFIQDKNECIVQSIEGNRAHLLAFVDLWTEKMRSFKRIKEWKSEDKVYGKKRPVIKMLLEREATCKLND